MCRKPLNSAPFLSRKLDHGSSRVFPPISLIHDDKLKYHQQGQSCRASRCITISSQQEVSLGLPITRTWVGSRNATTQPITSGRKLLTGRSALSSAGLALSPLMRTGFHNQMSPIVLTQLSTAIHEPASLVADLHFVSFPFLDSVNARGGWHLQFGLEVLAG